LNIPNWLLKLLPMWDYICPKCKKEVPQKSHTCPHCQENYGAPLKVPPKMLKDKEALADYVHKVIMPKVNPEMRTYLTNFFTVLFNDGFESGDFGVWTDNFADSGCTREVQSTVTHHGSYAAHFAVPAGASGRAAGCYKTFTQQTTCYIRQYLRVSSFPDNSTHIVYLEFDGISGSSGKVAIYVDSEGLKYWRLKTCTGTYDSASATINASQWYCIEVKVVVNAGAGEYRLYVDDSEVITQTGLDNSSAGDTSVIYPDLYFETYAQTSNQEGYWDCIVIADAYIGPQAGPSPADPMTGIFSDGFESGDFSAWTSSTASTGASISVVNAAPHHGTYCQASALTGSGTEYAFAQRSLSPTDTLYARCYFKTSALPPSGEVLGAILGFCDDSDNREGVGFHNNSGTYRVVISRCPNGGTGREEDYGDNVSLATDTWYCLELGAFIDDAAGWEKVWLDGPQVYSATGRDNNGNGATQNWVRAGINNYTLDYTANWGSGYTVNVDCIVVADAYIGTENDLEVNNLTVNENATVGNTLTVNGDAGVTNLNVASGLTLNGNAGDSGQVLTSNGSGNAPTWQTVSGGPDFITSIAPGAPFSVSSGALSLTPFAHTYISDWDTATSAFLTTVTPSNLSGSGAIPGGWTIGGSQVSGNISGNAASITGSIPHDKISDWNDATSSFVTSGSSVTFADVTVSGTATISLGLLSVTGAVSASGAVSAVINTLDDGSGNASFQNIEAYGVVDSKEYFYIPTSYQAWLDYMAQDDEGVTPFPETTSKFRVSDITAGQGGYATDLVGGLWKTDNGFPQTAPFFMTRHHLVVKKDFFCKGQVVSMEGCLTMYGGYAGWITNGYETNNPIVLLALASESEPKKDKLEIRTAYNHGFGGLKAGLIEGAASANGDAFKIGDNAYLCDRDETNGFVIEGATTRANAVLVFGSGKDCKIYRSTTGGYPHLRVQSPVGGGLVVEQNLSANAISSTTILNCVGYANVGSLKINGTEVITSGRVLQNITFSPSSISCTGLIAGNSGGASGQAFKVGDDLYICDRNETNGMVLEGAIDSTTATLVFGSEKTVKLYRSTAGGYAHLRIETPTGGGLVVEQNLNVGAMAYFTDLQTGNLKVYKSGQEENAGRISNQIWTDALEITGAGTTTANRKIRFFAQGGVTSDGVINATGYTNTSPSFTYPSRSIGTVYQNTTGKAIVVSVTLGLQGTGQPFYTHAILYVGATANPDVVAMKASNPLNSMFCPLIAIIPNNYYYKVYCDQNTSLCWVDTWTEYPL